MLTKQTARLEKLHPRAAQTWMSLTTILVRPHLDFNIIARMFAEHKKLRDS